MKKINNTFVFNFIYNNHELLNDIEESLSQDQIQELFLNEIKMQQWNMESNIDKQYIAVKTISELKTLIAEVAWFGKSATNMWSHDFSPAFIDIPFKKLETLIVSGGYSFVGGSFSEFEGHHQDDEIRAVLKK